MQIKDPAGEDKLNNRIVVLTIAIIVLFVVVIGRFIYLVVCEGESLRKEAEARVKVSAVFSETSFTDLAVTLAKPQSQKSIPKQGGHDYV